jgi:uncharacterized membrane protein (DUF373 family)
MQDLKMLQHPLVHDLPKITTAPDETLKPIDSSVSPIAPWYRNLRRSHIVRVLETVQDIIAVSLCIGLFCVMVLQLREIFLSLMTTTTLHFHEITADILFILILVELFRLLIIYLQEQRVSIGVSVEVAIVSVLREVIVKGILEVEWQQVVATCAFLISMAVLLVVRVWIPPTFEGINPEQSVSDRFNKNHHRAMD